MTLIPALALIGCCLLQAAPQDEKKPEPQEEKKPAPEKPETPTPPQDPVPPPDDDDDIWLLHVQADLRVGGWRTGSFDAMTAAGRRKIESTLLFDAGLDLKAVYSGWSLSLTADYASGKSITLQSAGLLVGMEIPLSGKPLPLDLQVAVGPIFGRLDVDVAEFGDFKSSVGFEARIAATSWFHDRIGLSLWADYRQISFKFDEPVLTGDTKTGGATFAVGAGLVMRF